MVCDSEEPFVVMWAELRGRHVCNTSITITCVMLNVVQCRLSVHITHKGCGSFLLCATFFLTSCTEVAESPDVKLRGNIAVTTGEWETQVCYTQRRRML